jgi:hypothetical protein
MPRVRNTFSILACLAALAGLPSVVCAQALPEPSVFFCGGALNAARIIHHVSGTAATTESLKAIQGRSIAIAHDTNTATVTVGSQTVTIPWTKPAKMICWNQPPGAVVLSSASSVSGDILAVLGAAFQYRKQKPWPADYPAHINFDDTDVYVLQRGRYDYVSIADHHDRHFAKGVYVETCRYQEFYRVDPTTLEVLPYNGCIVGQPVQGLPNALQLPH